MMTLSATCSLTCPDGLYNQNENDSSLVDGYEAFHPKRAQDHANRLHEAKLRFPNNR